MQLGDIEHPYETLGECRKHLDLLRALLEDPAWTLLCSYFSDSATHLEAAIIGRAVKPDTIYEQEYIKGRAHTLRTIPAFVGDYCETLEENIRRIMSLLKQEDEANARDTSLDYRTESARDANLASTGERAEPAP